MTLAGRDPRAAPASTCSPTATATRCSAAARAAGVDLPPADTWAKLVDELLTKHVEPALEDPTFILDYPRELSPFAKDHRTEPGLVERFEVYAGGDGVRKCLFRVERS